MPIYKFYKNGNENKFEEQVKGIAPEFRLLRLYNLIISPIDQSHNLKLVISLDGKGELYSVLLSNLFRATSNESILFFDAENKFKAIALPQGFKNLTFTVIAQSETKDFEITLSCEYNISLSKI